MDDCKYKISYSKDLNQSQLQAVATMYGKTLVIAGAGSGKTRTLIYRTSYLLENGVQGQNILLLTFTKKAANEIKNRVNALLGNDNANKITTGTFHAFCNMVLAKYSKLLGINSKFTILDQGDSEDLIDLIKKESFIAKKKMFHFLEKEHFKALFLCLEISSYLFLMLLQRIMKIIFVMLMIFKIWRIGITNIKEKMIYMIMMI